MVIPVRPVDIETAVAATPPHVEVDAAPEGGCGAAAAKLEANLSARRGKSRGSRARDTGRRFHRQEE